MKKTKTKVMLQNPEIKQIPKKEFKSALEAKEPLKANQPKNKPFCRYR